MAAANDTASMALFCDFENIALGVRDAQYEKFDIRPVLERLLAKGSIVVKKAYCDWDRYKGFKAAMHEANFELIEIPHVRQSGKNSADIRMVVDALDLCYTKAHVDTFVIISGDSDFSPLVSKLRENAKRVIGVGVKQSCSDLLVTNCDEFIYYDDLVREREGARSSQRREREKRTPEEEAKRREKQEERKTKAVDIVAATFVDLIADRGESERIWASVLKEVVKRRNPGFNESYFGFRSFGNLLEEAAQRGLLGFGRDDKGAYVFRAAARNLSGEGENGASTSEDMLAEGSVTTEPMGLALAVPESALPVEDVVAESEAGGNGRRRGRRGRGKLAAAESPMEVAPMPEALPEPVAATASQAEAGAPAEEEGAAVTPMLPVPEEAPKARRAGRRPRRSAADPAVSQSEEGGAGALAAASPAATPAPDVSEMPAELPSTAVVEEGAAAKPARSRRAPSRTPRARKPKASDSGSA